MNAVGPSDYTVVTSHIEDGVGVCRVRGYCASFDEARKAAWAAAERMEGSEGLCVSVWHGAARLWSFTPAESTEAA